MQTSLFAHPFIVYTKLNNADTIGSNIEIMTKIIITFANLFILLFFDMLIHLFFSIKIVSEERKLVKKDSEMILFIGSLFILQIICYDLLVHFKQRRE